MLAITVETKCRAPYQFEWSANSEEFRRLWEHCEESAADQGLDPNDVASQAIKWTATTKDNKIERGQAVWVVYAVLRHAADNIDLTSLVDHAGVLTGPPTIFDLAEHQHITANILVDERTFTMKLTGKSPLDS